MNNCLALHLPEPLPNCTRLVWFTARTDQRCRTLVWTCHCAHVIHELCTAGGQLYFRRIDLKTNKIVETRRTSTRDGQALWEACSRAAHGSDLREAFHPHVARVMRLFTIRDDV